MSSKRKVCREFPGVRNEVSPDFQRDCSLLATISILTVCFDLLRVEKVERDVNVVVITAPLSVSHQPICRELLLPIVSMWRETGIISIAVQ